MNMSIMATLALLIAVTVSFSLDARAGSKSHGGFETMATSKKCKKGYTYSKQKGKCVRKGGYRY